MTFTAIRFLKIIFRRGICWVGKSYGVFVDLPYTSTCPMSTCQCLLTITLSLPSMMLLCWGKSRIFSDLKCHSFNTKVEPHTLTKVKRFPRISVLKPIFFTPAMSPRSNPQSETFPQNFCAKTDFFTPAMSPRSNPVSSLAV